MSQVSPRLSSRLLAVSLVLLSNLNRADRLPSLLSAGAFVLVSLFLTSSPEKTSTCLSSDLCCVGEERSSLGGHGVTMSFILWSQSESNHLQYFGVSSSDFYLLLFTSEYISLLLERGHNLEVFMEGTRSRSGKLLPPKVSYFSLRRVSRARLLISKPVSFSSVSSKSSSTPSSPVEPRTSSSAPSASSTTRSLKVADTWRR